MSPMTDTEERLTTTLRYVAELPPGNVEVVPNVRPRTAGLSRYALRPVAGSSPRAPLRSAPAWWSAAWPSPASGAKPPQPGNW